MSHKPTHQIDSLKEKVLGLLKTFSSPLAGLASLQLNAVQYVLRNATPFSKTSLKVTKTYHDVAYKTNTLAAFDTAFLASLDTLTPSGTFKSKIKGICSILVQTLKEVSITKAAVFLLTVIQYFVNFIDLYGINTEPKFCTLYFNVQYNLIQSGIISSTYLLSHR